jgi:hypothetical protein
MDSDEVGSFELANIQPSCFYLEHVADADSSDYKRLTGTQTRKMTIEVSRFTNFRCHARFRSTASSSAWRMKR